MQNQICLEPHSQLSRQYPLPVYPCTTIGYERDLPGPQSQDDDEDSSQMGEESSPIVQELEPADHVPCSSSTMTTPGHLDETLTLLGFEMPTHAVGTDSKGLVTTGSDRKVTPELLSTDRQNAHLTMHIKTCKNLCQVLN